MVRRQPSSRNHSAVSDRSPTAASSRSAVVRRQRDPTESLPCRSRSAFQELLGKKIAVVHSRLDRRQIGSAGLCSMAKHAGPAACRAPERKQRRLRRLSAKDRRTRVGRSRTQWRSTVPPTLQRDGSGFAQPATLGVTLVIAYAEATGAPAAFLPATQIVPESSTVRPVQGCPSNPSAASAQEKSFVPLPVSLRRLRPHTNILAVDAVQRLACSDLAGRRIPSILPRERYRAP